LTETQKIQTLLDEELLNAYLLNEDAYLLEELFGRYVRFVYVVCMKYMHSDELAKDMSMHVFEKVMIDMKRFEIRNFKSWLHVVTKNYCLMQLRAEKNTRFVSWENEKETAQVMENTTLLHPDNESETEMRLGQLEKAINMLESAQKQCVELFYLKEKSYKEVADITGFSMNEVKSYIQNGKRNLKNVLVNQGDILLFIGVCIYMN